MGDKLFRVSHANNGDPERTIDMEVSLAFYHLCKRFKDGGITKMAKLMGMSADVLQKKLSPTCDTHHLNVDEAEEITLLSGDPAGAIELARVAGLACIPMPRINADGTLIRGMSEIARDFADMVKKFDETIEDNRVSPNECDSFDRLVVELYAACMAQSARMRAFADSRAPVFPIRSSGS